MCHAHADYPTHLGWYGNDDIYGRAGAPRSLRAARLDMWIVGRQHPALCGRNAVRNRGGFGGALGGAQASLKVDAIVEEKGTAPIFSKKLALSLIPHSLQQSLAMPNISFSA